MASRRLLTFKKSSSSRPAARGWRARQSGKGPPDGGACILSGKKILARGAAWGGSSRGRAPFAAGVRKGRGGGETRRGKPRGEKGKEKKGRGGAFGGGLG